jgi:hypothetical protein
VGQAVEVKVHSRAQFDKVLRALRPKVPRSDAAGVSSARELNEIVTRMKQGKRPFAGPRPIAKDPLQLVEDVNPQLAKHLRAALGSRR